MITVILKDETLIATFSTLASPIETLLATAGFWWAARRSALFSRELLLAWGLLTAAHISWLFGDILWAVLDVGLGISPFPSIADLFYFLYYPLFIAGALLIPMKRLSRGEWLKLCLDMGIVALATMLVFWYFWIGPLVEAEPADSLTTVLSVAYPVADFLLLTALFAVISRKLESQPQGPILLLAAGIALQVFTDAVFGYQSTAGTYAAGILDMGWTAALFLAGLAGFLHADRVGSPAASQPDRAPNEDPKTATALWPVYIPYVWLAASYLLLPFSYGRDISMTFSTLVIWVGGIIILVVIRQVVSLQENTRLLDEQKRVDQALRESEEKFRGVFETSRDFTFISTLDGRILDNNESARGFFGYSSDEIRDMNMRDLYVYPEKRERFIKSIIEKGYVENRELKLKKKDGTIIDAQMTVVTRKDRNGNVIGFQGSVRDITEKRKMEQQLLQSEKLSTIGTMISGAAHELNNPLTSIIGNAQLLAKRNVPEDIKGKLDVILRESIRSSKIVGGLLAFAREHKPERSMVNINDIIIESMKLKQYDLKVNNIDVKLSLADDFPETSADPFHLQQVFINLINNARDVLVGQENAALSIRTYRKDDAVLIEFEDNGPGIPDAVAKRIFDPFFTTKEVGKGTGLGLSMAYGIVREHDGTISVESEPAKGAKFTVTLPIRDDIQPAAGTAKTTVKPRPGVRTVLVVEDEAPLRELLAEAITDEGYFVESASRGEQAIQLIEKRKFDAVISDIKMPGIGGKELYLYIQKHYPEIAEKIIFITGDVLSKDTLSFLQITNNRFIEKPFNIDDLVELLNDVLAG